MHGRPTGLFTAAPLAFAYASAASHGPSAERPASQLGTGAPRTESGVHNQGKLGAHS
jgi:hypothetical protein